MTVQTCFSFLLAVLLILVPVLLPIVAQSPPYSSAVMHTKNEVGGRGGGEERMKSYRYDLIHSSDQDLLGRAPSLVFNFSAISPEIFVPTDDEYGECANDTRLIYDGVQHLRPWALQMLDASAKVPNGVLKGNLNWWGSYSECINVQVAPVQSGGDSAPAAPQTGAFSGQYCSVTLSLNMSSTSGGDDVEARNAIKDFLDVMMLDIPMGKGSIPDLVVGLCVPSSCSRADVKSSVENAFQHILIPKSMVMLANVQSCQTKDSIKLDTATICVISIFGVFALVIVVATIYEIVDGLVQRHKMAKKLLHESQRDVLGASTEIQTADGADPERQRALRGTDVLLCFSALSNARQLLAVGGRKKSGGDKLRVLDGMRFLSMTWIVMVHSYSLAIVSSELWDNMGEILNATRLVLFQAIIRGAIGVDTFLFMSGLLLVYVGMEKVKSSRNRLRCLGYFYIHRIIRVAPAYFMTIAWVAGPSDYVAGGGPLWPQIVQGKKDCHLTWWKSLLYIGNFGDTTHMCAPHTWYIAMDMQFYIVGCVLLICLQRYRNVGLVLIALCGVASCVTAGVISAVESIPSSALLFNVPQARLIAYSIDYYIKPYCRMSPYAVGMLTGYFLLNSGETNKKIKPVVAYGLWVVTAITNLSVVYGTYGEFTSAEEPNVVAGSIYNALAGTAWSLGIAWIVYASHIGYGGFIKTFLSLKMWVPLSRLTYGAYLVHYIIIYTFYESRRDEKFHFDAFLMVTLFLGFLTLSCGTAFVLALGFESPFVNLERVLMAIKKKPVNVSGQFPDADRNFNKLDA